MPSLQAAPEFLEETQYANPSDMLNTPFQRGFHTDQPRFVWFQGQPDMSANFGVWMSAQHDRKMTWLDVVNFREFVGGATTTTPIFVDVGGGIGHQCALLQRRYPDLAGRIILQDSASVVSRALPTPGVDATIYDFWSPQPVQGARVYYLRYIMHDYPDEKCLIILRNIKAAMTQDSVLLVDDMIIPNKGAHSHATDRDIAMMVNFAAMERTEKQWSTLFAAAGLKLVHAAAYNETSGESVQVVAIEE
jgi:demethylsterigmatocystin 6-O-methyltransferase